jgi:hypothetical protein
MSGGGSQPDSEVEPVDLESSKMPGWAGRCSMPQVPWRGVGLSCNRSCL